MTIFCLDLASKYNPYQLVVISSPESDTGIEGPKREIYFDQQYDETLDVMSSDEDVVISPVQVFTEEEGAEGDIRELEEGLKRHAQFCAGDMSWSGAGDSCRTQNPICSNSVEVVLKFGFY